MYKDPSLHIQKKMHICVTQASGDAIVVQDSKNIALFGHKVALCHSHRCDIAMVLRGGGSRP